ncbi:expressed unknown protein [Seminavis robusta]|uniref:Uncharacterized protein n=1 Tax=Seminavis robusta TaxID=568900 RepID=A0A9N8HIB5_9STRA|nr:expressed unknown protein [Seminavis robusta]|eukprot:Sro490_g153570.1 n/a (442) ;mRNA; f:49277-50779
MAKGKSDKSRHPSRQKPPPLDQYIKPAVALGVALLAYQFFKGLNSEILRVDVTDEMQLREVLLGELGSGKNYASLCHDETSNIPVSSVFQDAHNDGSAPADFRLVDCNYVLPTSEKTIADRFKLKLKDRPTIFVSGAVGEPRQVPVKHLKTGKQLVKALRSLLEPKAAKIETTQDLRAKCLEKDVCGLLLKGGKIAPNWLKDAMGKLVKEFPKISLTAIDSSVLYVKNLEDQLEEYDESTKQPRFVVFKKVSGSTETGKDRLITSIVPLEGSVSYGTLSNTLASVAGGSATPKKLSSLPLVKTRTKKLVQEERIKRQRKQDQQKRQDSGGSSTPGGQFHANDGSKEGRKAERERRRAEHRAQNPDYKPKTPEELKEIERQRRIRMEEMAKEWNMEGEDLPPEGDPMLDEDDFDLEEGETMEYEADEDDGDDEEGDDVMDLD